MFLTFLPISLLIHIFCGDLPGLDRLALDMLVFDPSGDYAD